MITALLHVRNAAWVARYSLPALLQWVDGAVILLHCCDDGTAKIVRSLQRKHRIEVLYEHRPAYSEVEFRQRLLLKGRELGGTLFALVDDDEVLTANLLPEIRSRFEALEPGEVLDLAWLQLWRSLDVWRVDNIATMAMGFRDRPDMHWAPGADGYPLHQRNPRPTPWRQRPCDGHGGGIMHLQRVNWRRAQSRQARYQLAEWIDWPHHRGSAAAIRERHNRSIAEPEDMVLEPVPPEWWAYPGLKRSLIDVDAEPWELAEVRRLVAQHGRAKFAELSLYGLV